MAKKRIQADVAGKVWKIEAQVGARLALEQTILIIESMKMEIPVQAPAPGTLLEILVQEGQAVAEGQDVAVVEQ